MNREAGIPTTQCPALSGCTVFSIYLPPARCMGRVA